MTATLIVACARAPGRAADTGSSVKPDSNSVASGIRATPAPTDTPAKTPESSPAASPPKPNAGSATPSPTATVLTGKVVAGGLAGDPVTMLQIEGAKPTRLVGPLEPELRRLGSATVWVTGAPTAGPPNASFTVDRYEIVLIDGVKPLVGLVSARNGGSWLIGG